MRLALILLSALLTIAMASAAGRADSIDIRSVTVPLNPRDTEATQVGELEFLAGFALASSDARWGGFSSMILAAEGRRLLAVSDFGNWLSLDLVHDDAGRLTGVGAAEIGALPGPDGQPLDRKGDADAEALALGPDGGLLVAFERAPRLWRYAPTDPPFASPPTIFPAPRGMVALPPNGGVEALAMLDGGDLVALAEGPDGSAPASAGWLLRDGKWHPIAWTRTLPYRPTDADILPNGDLLVLERRYSLATGPGARLSVVVAGNIAPRTHLAGVELAELELPQTVDNFECVAAGVAPDGATLIYLLSDDNRNLLQRTLLLQFRWRPTPPG